MEMGLLQQLKVRINFKLFQDRDGRRYPLMLSYPYMDSPLAKKQLNINGVAPTAVDMSKYLTLRLGSDFLRASMTMELGR